MKECPNCKKLNPEGNSFCEGCGNSLNTTANNLDTNNQQTVDLNNNLNTSNQQTVDLNNNLNTSNQQTVDNQKSSVTKSGYNKNAIISISCSIICFIIFWWLAFVGISSGVAALKEINEKDQKGKGLAIAGIVISVAGLILYFAGKAVQ